MKVPLSGEQQPRGAGASLEPDMMTEGAAGLGDNNNKNKNGNRSFDAQLRVRERRAPRNI